MDITLLFSENCDKILNGRSVDLTKDEFTRFANIVLVAKTSRERILENLSKELKANKNCLESMEDVIRRYDSAQTELMEGDFGNVLMFSFIDMKMNVDGIMTSYGVMIDPNVLYHADEQSIYLIDTENNKLTLKSICNL